MVYLTDEMEQTKTYIDMVCTACALALDVRMGHVQNQGCRDCWSVSTFYSSFSCLPMYACSMLLCIWCLGVLCTGYPPLAARQPTESWLCVYLCGSQHSRTQHRFVPLSMHCQYASVIEHICVCIAMICFWVQYLWPKEQSHEFMCSSTPLAASVLLYGIGRIARCAYSPQRGWQLTC